MRGDAFVHLPDGSGTQISRRERFLVKLRTLGHATLVLFHEGACPILLTDPWLVGSAYWRSWWLQHYPSDEELDWAASSAFIYVTHTRTPPHLFFFTSHSLFS